MRLKEELNIPNELVNDLEEEQISTTKAEAFHINLQEEKLLKGFIRIGSFH